MIELGMTITYLNKKYVIVDDFVENNISYYVGVELDNEEPTENCIFLKKDIDKIIKVTDEDEVDFLKSILINRFLAKLSSD